MIRAVVGRKILQLTDSKPPTDIAYVYIGAGRLVLDFAEAAPDIMMYFSLRAAGPVLEPSPR